MRLDTAAATKNPGKVLIGECTEFKLHRPIKGVIDFVEMKLRALSVNASSLIDRSRATFILESYREGRIAVGFHKGVPVFVDVVKNA